MATVTFRDNKVTNNAAYQVTCVTTNNGAQTQRTWNMNLTYPGVTGATGVIMTWPGINYQRYVPPQNTVIPRYADVTVTGPFNQGAYITLSWVGGANADAEPAAEGEVEAAAGSSVNLTLSS
ncbi:hypothetical protein TWF694_001884 [Orbilia ellipsospora]|uniref:Uncharacterized protein n=1 Tax=Orbilia ellipsospora TaxID=2528407 RepID=A0AAV9X6R4_9PEZI